MDSTGCCRSSRLSTGDSGKWSFADGELPPRRPEGVSIVVPIAVSRSDHVCEPGDVSWPGSCARHVGSITVLSATRGDDRNRENCWRLGRIERRLIAPCQAAGLIPRLDSALASKDPSGRTVSAPSPGP